MLSKTLSRLVSRKLATAPIRNFQVYRENPTDPTVNQWIVGTFNGFLPRNPPVSKLPEKYKEIEEFMDNMRIIRKDGSDGYTKSISTLKESKHLPTFDLSKETDTGLLTALYRDYSFIASTILFEECHWRHIETGEYGLARDRVPRNIAVPLAEAAKKIDMYPFLEYSSYALFNYQKIDPAGSLNPENVKAIRLFEGSADENGFIIGHIGMDQHSGDLVRLGIDMMDSAEARDRAKFDIALKEQYENTKLINEKMELMWSISETSSYSRIRTFIFGIKDQPMFPNGVILEGVNDDKPVYYRGETGANDTMVPTLDNLMQIFDRMPDNPLTKIL
jgi:indoleamine 2,3-dioxygenase